MLLDQNSSKQEAYGKEDWPKQQPNNGNCPLIGSDVKSNELFTVSAG